MILGSMLTQMTAAMSAVGSGTASSPSGSTNSQVAIDMNFLGKTVSIPSLNSGPLSGFRNLIINGSFRFNQRGYASGAALPANGYGHDRWRDNTNTAGGTSYTFTEASQADFGVSHSVDTVITIAAGGALTQVVEAASITGQVLTLSWTGSSQATLSFYNNGSVTTLYSSAASPITVTPPIGDTFYVTFGAGTLGNVQLEPGTVATPFERRSLCVEQFLCQRYYELMGQGVPGQAVSASTVTFSLRFVTPKRTAPTIALTTTSPQIVQPLVQYVTASNAAINAQTGPDNQGSTINMTGFSGLNVNAPACLTGSNIFAVSAEL